MDEFVDRGSVAKITDADKKVIVGMFTKNPRPALPQG